MLQAPGTALSAGTVKRGAGRSGDFSRNLRKTVLKTGQKVRFFSKKTLYLGQLWASGPPSVDWHSPVDGSLATALPGRSGRLAGPRSREGCRRGSGTSVPEPGAARNALSRLFTVLTKGAAKGRTRDATGRHHSVPATVSPLLANAVPPAGLATSLEGEPAEVHGRMTWFDFTIVKSNRAATVRGSRLGTLSSSETAGLSLSQASSRSSVLAAAEPSSAAAVSSSRASTVALQDRQLPHRQAARHPAGLGAVIL